MTANSPHIQQAIDTAVTARAKHDAEHYREHLGCEWCFERHLVECRKYIADRASVSAENEHLGCEFCLDRIADEQGERNRLAAANMPPSALTELVLSADELLREHWGHDR